MARQDGAHRVPPALLRELYRQSWARNLKIFLFYGMLIGCGVLAARAVDWKRR